MDNPKYQSLMDTGKKLFWKYGIKRVTIEEICREANVSKMTFYKFFPNKTELAKTIWETVIKKSLKQFKVIVDSDLAFTEKIKEMFAIKLKASEDISMEFINDVYRNPELGLQSQIEKFSMESFRIFTEFLVKSQKEGLIRKDIKIEFILHYFNVMSKLFDDTELVSKYEHPQELILESMNFMFYGLLVKE